MTDGDLYDLLRATFGVGDWDEDHELPWWKYRANEVAKVGRIRKARKVDLEDLATTVAYCKAKGIDIRDSSWLYRHILDALRWAREEATAVPTDFETDYEAAIGEAYEHGLTEWIERFHRALGDGRREVLDQWRNRSHE